ncbi:MAG: bifunctional transaldolase/phosoglucose isomerase [Thermomicrobiales bacterium]|nr:bifunctional transaldolase/phosoglucose isomerase [Thermomicrobiales bacterium]
MARNPLQQLTDYGQSVWYDNLSRDLVESGGLQELIDNSGVVGITSNPTIFDKAISGSDLYDEQIRRLAASGRSTSDMYDAIVIQDIQSAADVLRAVYDRHDEKDADGFVSLEVSPSLAHDTSATVADVRRLYAALDRPNVMIKIPGTFEGTPAIEQMLYEGININITLLFSLDAYRNVAEAYLTALERRVEEGKPIGDIHSVASFFVSRVDTEADKRLQAIIDAEPGSDRANEAQALQGTLAIANARLAYAAFEEIFTSERFKKLQESGARVQRPLWASTSTKNPAYSDTLYVDELIGPDTVQTLAPASIEAFGDHGHLARTVDQDVDGAREIFRRFEALGVSYDDITATLVREGVASFMKSFEDLLHHLDEKRNAFVAEIEQARQASIGALAGAVDQSLSALAAEKVATRLQDGDASLWGDDEKVRASASTRLGWLPVVQAMRAKARADQFSDFAAEVRERGFRYAVLLGMGGSSLAPDVFSRMFGVDAGFPELIVLDTTNPGPIARVAAEIGDDAMFIVSTKSGTTVETMSLYRFFFERAGGDASRFIAITDPGTPLETEAKERGFWRVFANPSDIGGRYSALSYFGLVPLATLGMDVLDVLDHAMTMLPINDEQHPGVWLGAALSAAQQAGRDKLTIIADDSWAPFADWLEQLIAESTGKHGTGILPVIAESLDDADHYGDDRLFVHFDAGENGKAAALAQALRNAGQPVISIGVDIPADLRREFVRWRSRPPSPVAVLSINPFDEPNVQEAKDATNAVLRGESTGSQPPTDAGEAVRAAVTAAAEDGYVAILAYVDPTADVRNALNALRSGIWRQTGRRSPSALDRAISTRLASCTRAVRRPARSCCWSSSQQTTSRFLRRRSRLVSCSPRSLLAMPRPSPGYTVGAG